MNLPFNKDAVFYHEDETNCLLLIIPQRHWPFFSLQCLVWSKGSFPQIYFKEEQLEASTCVKEAHGEHSFHFRHSVCHLMNLLEVMLPKPHWEGRERRKQKSKKEWKKTLAKSSGCVDLSVASDNCWD